MDDLIKQMKEYSGDWWFTLILVREVAKEAAKNDVSSVEIDVLSGKDRPISIKMKR